VVTGICDPVTLGASHQVLLPLAGDLEMNVWMYDHVDAPSSVCLLCAKDTGQPRLFLRRLPSLPKGDRYAARASGSPARKTGSAKRSRARVTSSSASRLERSGAAAITISSGGNVGNASAIASSGSASPTRPSARTPLSFSRSTNSVTRSSARRRAPSSSESQCRSREFSAGATTGHRRPAPPVAARRRGRR